MQKLIYLLVLVFSSISFAGWQVDCSNHCFFNDIQPNCQGVYWLYPNGDKNYSSWNTSQNGCFEVDSETLTSHLIYPSQINCNCAPPKSTPPADKSMSLTSATRSKLELLRAQVQAWTMCAPSPTIKATNLFHPFSPEETRNCQEMRKAGIDRAYLSPRGCYRGLSPDYDWTCNFHGDQLASTPSACLAGYMDLCNQIKDAQDPITGAFYRNAYMRRHPQVAEAQPAFSRDQLYGAMAYWTKTKDKTSMWKWLNFVKNNGTAPWFGGVQMRNACPPRPNIPKPKELTQEQWDKQLPDDRCAIIPQTWGMLFSVAKHIGITAGELYQWDADIYNSMVGGFLTLDAALLTTSFTVPSVGSSAYQAANTFDALFLRFSSNGNNSQVQQALDNINRRTGTLSPLFHYAAEGKPTEYGAYLIRKYCSAAKPNWGDWYKSGYEGYPANQTGYKVRGESYFSTSYQYAGGMNSYGTFVVPNGHDCLTFLNLYLGNGNLTELQCDSGDRLINGACLRHALPVPNLAAIAGIGYQIHSNGKISYMSINQNSCPYGGSLVTHTWPVRCEFDSGLAPSQLQSGVTYWVNPDPSAPGVYYNRVGGKCMYGGTPAVYPTCRLKSFASPQLRAGVGYWVDPNPSWPGIYYAQINGQCPYGGSFSGPNCQVKALGGSILNPDVQYFTRSNYSNPGVYYYPRVIPEKRRPVIFDKVMILKSGDYGL